MALVSNAELKIWQDLHKPLVAEQDSLPAKKKARIWNAIYAEQQQDFLHTAEPAVYSSSSYALPKSVSQKLITI
jgi:hypothetical protein